MAENIIELKHISKQYDEEYALKNISLSIQKREFLTLLGPSGCGKTTMLRCIAGFEEPDSGDILFEGKRINDLPPYQRKVNTIFQRYSLFPHMNVFDNIAFGLNIQKLPKKQIEKEVMDMLLLVGLEGFEKRWPESLSGGQQQRVAIARALVNKPQVLLLDEPLAALDLKMRKEMQGELKKMQQQVGITFVFVTHDQEEALTMSDTIVVMNKGEIVQIGKPTDIYNEPINAYVADFIGESNIVDGIMNDDFLCSFAGSKFVCLDSGFAKDEPVEIVIRPEDIEIVDKERGMVQADVLSVVFMGVHNEVICQLNGEEWTVHTTHSVNVGDTVGLIIEPDSIHVMKESDMALAGDEEEEFFEEED